MMSDAAQKTFAEVAVRTGEGWRCDSSMTTGDMYT